MAEEPTHIPVEEPTGWARIARTVRKAMTMKYRSVAWLVATTALTMLGGPTSCNDHKGERGSTSSAAHSGQANAVDSAKSKETKTVEKLSAADQKAFDELANKANELDKKLEGLAQGDPSKAAAARLRAP